MEHRHGLCVRVAVYDCQGGGADLGTDTPLNLGKGETGKAERLS